MGILTGDSNLNKPFNQRVYLCFSGSFKPAYKTIRWLLSLMIPISFGVMLLDYSGFLVFLANYTAPFVKLLGLRGEAALVLLSGGLLNIYSAVAVIETINFSSREICIMALMSLIAHNLIIETAVQKKTGSSALQMVILRISVAIIGGVLLNILLPPDNTLIQTAILHVGRHLVFIEMLQKWGMDTMYLLIKIIVIIFSLNFLQRILDEFSITVYLSKIMTPVLRFFGLPLQSAFMWLIANIIGLAWGSSVLIEQTEQGKITRDEADILNHHIAISHSLLEDTLLFVAIGVSAFWITVPRLVLAFIVVWGYRLIKSRMKS